MPEHQQPLQDDLLRVVRSVRNRWRLRVLLRGAAFGLVAALAVALVAGWAIDASRFDPAAVHAARAAAYLTLAVLLAAWWRPLARRISDERVALYIEEHEPSLRGRLVNAVELGRAPAAGSAAMIERTIQAAVEECGRIDDGKRVERAGLWRSTGLFAGTTAASVVLFLIGPAFLHHTTPLLLDPFRATEEANPYSISVDPGDTVLARGADLEVTATLNAFDSADVDLYVKTGDTWETWGMLAEDGKHRLIVFDLREKTEYRVEASGVRSPIYTVEVRDLPHVDSVDVTYHFPSYTGLDPLVQKDSGDVAALAGTEARLTVRTTLPVPGGALEVTLDGNETTQVELQPADDGTLAGSLTVTRRGTYRILLDSPVDDGGRRIASGEYVIDVFEDQPPILTLSKPGRDLKVTPLEELDVEIHAQDDYGVRSVELVYAVNGGDEQTVALYRGDRKDFNGGHTFYLEEMQGEDGGFLQPGDLVAYHARARDAYDGEDAGPHQQVSDIYFLEVRPFDRNYRQADAGSMPGGQGMERGELAQQQRRIVAAAFKLAQTSPGAERDADLVTVALSQGKIRASVLALMQRLGPRSLGDGGDETPAMSNIADLLPEAARHMEEAEEHLGEKDPAAALPPAQKALQKLQRLEAEVRDIQVAQGQQGGGGGDVNDELADLFEMDMERLANQYEQIQRSRQQTVDDTLDETLEKLRELSRRQQQENERMRARSRMANQDGRRTGSSGQSQRELADEAENTARQLERLAREESLPEMAEIARRLREAAEEMRRAAASGERDSEALGNAALDQLREARRQLERDRSGRIARDTRRALEKSRELRDQQERMTDRVERLDRSSSGYFENLQGVHETKQQMGDAVGDLEAAIDQLSRDALRDQPEASRRLRDAAERIRDEKIREKILYSRGVVEERSKDYALNFEEHIAGVLDGLVGDLDAAQSAIGTSREQRLLQALEETREAVTGLESLADTLQGGGQGSASQLDRALGQRRAQLEELGLRLRGEGVDTEDLERIVGRLRGLEIRGDNLAAAAALEGDIVRGLKEFEYGLRRALGVGQEERRLEVADEDVPDGYEELVARYYKALAQSEGKDPEE